MISIASVSHYTVMMLCGTGKGKGQPSLCSAWRAIQAIASSRAPPSHAIHVRISIFRSLASKLCQSNTNK